MLRYGDSLRGRIRAQVIRRLDRQKERAAIFARLRAVTARESDDLAGLRRLADDLQTRAWHL